MLRHQNWTFALHIAVHSFNAALNSHWVLLGFFCHMLIYIQSSSQKVGLGLLGLCILTGSPRRGKDVDGEVKDLVLEDSM